MNVSVVKFVQDVSQNRQNLAKTLAHATRKSGPAIVRTASQDSRSAQDNNCSVFQLFRIQYLQFFSKNFEARLMLLSVAH